MNRGAQCHSHSWMILELAQFVSHHVIRGTLLPFHLSLRCLRRREPHKRLDPLHAFERRNLQRNFRVGISRNMAHRLLLNKGNREEAQFRDQVK